MSKNLATIPVSPLVEMTPLPADLRVWLAEGYEMRWTAPRSDGSGSICVPAWLDLTPTIRKSARQELPRYRAANESVKLGQLNAWMALLMLCRGSPSRDTMPGVVMLFHMALGNLPSGAFTPETQRRAAQTFDFFPSPAAVCNFLVKEVEDIRRATQILEYLAGDC